MLVDRHGLVAKKSVLRRKIRKLRDALIRERHHDYICGWVGTLRGARRAKGRANRPEICEAPEGGGEETQGYAREDFETGYHAVQNNKIREFRNFPSRGIA